MTVLLLPDQFSLAESQLVLQVCPGFAATSCLWHDDVALYFCSAVARNREHSLEICSLPNMQWAGRLLMKSECRPFLCFGVSPDVRLHCTYYVPSSPF
jgi:hypothetical protein